MFYNKNENIDRSYRAIKDKLYHVYKLDQTDSCKEYKQSVQLK